MGHIGLVVSMQRRTVKTWTFGVFEGMDYLGLRAHSREARDVYVSDVLRASGFMDKELVTQSLGREGIMDLGKPRCCVGGFLKNMTCVGFLLGRSCWRIQLRGKLVNRQS